MRKSKSKPKSKKTNRGPLKIAITFDFSLTHGYFLKPEMVTSLTGRGVQLIPLLYETKDLGSTLKHVDGLVIPGGLGDVDPMLYGQCKKYDCVEIIRERCEFESHLLEKYLKLKKPLLAICWGLQMMNVFLGGSLLQDIPSDKETDLSHQQSEPKHLPTHWVHFQPGSQARKLFKVESLFVNSTHHQGIDTLAKDLIAEGQSEDGLVESVWLKNHPFCLGVQWHPERLENDPVIPTFLKACQRLRS